MCDLWNDFELTKPPQITVPVSSKNAPNVGRLQNVIHQYFRRYRPQEVEFAEASALLGRLMARRKNSFHGMMGFRSVVKCNTATCRLLRIDLTRELELFHGSLPDFVIDSADIIEMPTKNNFDYVLIRLLNAYGVYGRIRECCLQAAEYFTKLMRNNFFMDTCTLFLAVLAKLYSLSALLGNKSVDLYNQLRPMREKFTYVHKMFNFNLPEKLEKFSECDAIELPKTNSIIMKNYATIHTIPPKLTAVRSLNSWKKRKSVDVGVEISREPISSSQTKSFNADTELATIETTKRFISSENAARKQSLNQSITKDILPHEWIGATRLFERKILANEHKKALSIFRKFIVNKIS